MNLRWTWNPDAQRLFASMDPKLWDATHHNPIKTLKLLPPERRELIAHDRDFVEQLRQCERELRHYLSARTWFDRMAPTVGANLVFAPFQKSENEGEHKVRPYKMRGIKHMRFP